MWQSIESNAFWYIVNTEQMREIIIHQVQSSIPSALKVLISCNSANICRVLWITKNGGIISIPLELIIHGEKLVNKSMQLVYNTDPQYLHIPQM